jgi:hypothetical protein
MEILSFPLKPQAKSLNALQISIPISWAAKVSDKPLKLTSGRHTIRVNFKPMVGRVYKSDPEPSPAISNPVEIEILPESVQVGGEIESSTVTAKYESLAPKIEPLPHERVGEMFDRIEKSEEIDLKLVYQSLIGPHMTLRAMPRDIWGFMETEIQFRT